MYAIDIVPAGAKVMSTIWDIIQRESKRYSEFEVLSIVNDQAKEAILRGGLGKKVSTTMQLRKSKPHVSNLSFSSLPCHHLLMGSGLPGSTHAPPKKMPPVAGVVDRG